MIGISGAMSNAFNPASATMSMKPMANAALPLVAVRRADARRCVRLLYHLSRRCAAIFVRKRFSDAKRSAAGVARPGPGTGGPSP